VREYNTRMIRVINNNNVCIRFFASGFGEAPPLLRRRAAAAAMAVGTTEVLSDNITLFTFLNIYSVFPKSIRTCVPDMTSRRSRRAPDYQYPRQLTLESY